MITSLSNHDNIINIPITCINIQLLNTPTIIQISPTIANWSVIHYLIILVNTLNNIIHSLNGV